MGMPVRAEQAQAGYVILTGFCWEGVAAPVTLVSWRSHRVKRVVASASAAEAMGLFEAIAQGYWVRALHERREQENVPHLGHRFKGQLRSFTQRDSRPQ